MSPAVNLTAYQKAIAGLHASFAVTEKAIQKNLNPEQQSQWQFQSSVSKLQADLQNLKIKNEPNAPAFSLDSEAQAIGAIYVLLGSSLGGAMIAKHLAHHLQLDESSGLAFYGSSHEAHPRWREFKMRLNDHFSVHPTEISELVTGAQKTFQLFTKIFKGE